MDTDPLPFELTDSTDDKRRREYERLWALLQSDAESFYDVDRAWNELADDLDLDPSGAEADSSSAAAAPTHVSDDVSAPVDAPRSDARSERDPAAGRAAESASEARLVGWRTGIGTALALLLVVGAVAIWWQQPVSVRTAAGEQATVSLPDGSTVELNGGSRLRYPRGFAVLPGITQDTRTVRFEGEAFFSVRPGERPFRVRTENARVEVLGTKFSLRARQHAGAPRTEIVLTEGRVQLQGREAGSSSAAGARSSVPNAVVLDSPGSRSRIEGRSDSPTAPDVIDLKYAAAWRNGGFAVQDRPLSAILRDLELQFGTQVRLEADRAEPRPMTLHYAPTVDLEAILGDICVVQGLQYQKTQQGYTLVPADRSTP